tara:strand:+ start:171 stop:347 length:177 start_codon:yes stop_codon:yes gene_type:complete
MESKQLQATIVVEKINGKYINKEEINKEEISKEVSDFMVAQMKYDRKDIRHKFIYIRR